MIDLNSKYIPPTLQFYSELQQAFNHFNRLLFDNKLPECIITLQRESKTYGYYSVQRFVKQDGTRIDEIAMNPEYFAIRTIPETLSTLVHEMVHLQQQHFGAPGRGRYHNHEWANWMEYIGLIPSNTGKEGGKRTGDRVSHYILKKGKFDYACQQLMTDEYTLTWMDRFPPPRSLVAAAHQVNTIIKPTLESADNEGQTEQINTSGTIELSENRMLLGEALLGSAIAVPDEQTLIPSKVNRSNREKYSCPNCDIQVWGKPDLNIICGDCKLPLKIS